MSEDVHKLEPNMLRFCTVLCFNTVDLVQSVVTNITKGPLLHVHMQSSPFVLLNVKLS